MKQAQIRKPILNTTEALKFATESIKTGNEGNIKNKDKIRAQTGLNSSGNTRIFLRLKAIRD